MNLTIFNQSNFLGAIKSFFKELNVPMNYISDQPTTAQDILQSFYKDNDVFKLINDVYFAGMVDDEAFKDNQSLNPDKIKSDYDGILVFGITLMERPNNLLPTRSQLAEIARTFNRAFYFTPVVIIFKYENYLAFANTERLKYKQEWREGEKAGKVSLLKDIDIANPHSGHERILKELKIPMMGSKRIDSFSKLYSYWQEIFSVSLLNKKFYLELSNWYFWATKNVTFPGKPTLEDAYKKNVKYEDLLQEHRATNVIRMLTRLLFVWFLKEKKLIPEELFQLEDLQKNILKDIDPYHDVGLFKEMNTQSIYYKAILQNLFFATLNCPIEGDKLDKRKRGFRIPDSDFGTLFLMRYEKYFEDKQFFLSLVNDCVPFLNGGLFECLDERGQGEKKEDRIWIDGFSDNLPKGEQLIVPDYLFFGLEEEEDLSEIVGIKDKKYKQAAVKGLINILKSYKFTITENTPIEEEVALDPELLGKVFENLLASYNPETKTTARKQTGSFYTPRNIVNYMVDESLVAYLKNNITDWEGIDEEIVNKELHILTSFDSTVPFVENPNLQKKIIIALSTCTILDPACGSGAFPMGILQKMVHILQKLDSNNEIWKEVQLENARKESDAAFEIEDKQAREERLIEINEAFDQGINDPNYARKLFLIENCIYGVDIQPIATQISKLRFFISLVVEQKVNKVKANFGIRPLPNLETKFVAANTLIGINKDGGLFETDEVKQVEEELKIVRHKIFSLRSKERKIAWRKKDEELRQKLSNILKKQGLPLDSAEKLSKWNPYDQNASSSFFDPEWMFNIKKGFDIITGNPPWGAYLSIEDKQHFKNYYKDIDSSTPNSFAYFIGEAVNHSNGIISFVLPDSILIKDFSKTRKLLQDHIYEISWYLNTGIPEENRPFVYVEHDVCVLLINNKVKSEICNISKHMYDFTIKTSIIDRYTINKKDFIKEEHDYSFNLKIKTIESNLYSQLKTYNTLSEILQCHEGIHTGNSRELLFHNSKINQSCKPLFYGGRAGDKIKNYISYTSGWFVDYRNEIIDKNKGNYASLRDERIFKFPKIYITRTGNPVKAFYDENNYASNNFFSLQFKNYKNNNENSLKSILPLILSKFANFYIRVFAAPRLGDTFIETKIFHILKIPYPEEIIENRILKIFCDLIIILIDQNKTFDILQNIMDSIILNLYFPEHMTQRGIDIITFVEQDIAEITQGKKFEVLNEFEKLHIIESMHEKWSHPDNEVNNRIKLFAVRSPEILKPILES